MSAPASGGAHRAHRRSTRPRWLFAVIATAMAVLAVASVVHLGGGREDRAQSTAQSAWSVFDAVSVSGRVGAVPVVSVNGTIRAGGVKSRVLHEGDGRRITAGAPVLLSITAFDADDGKNLSPQGRPQLTVGPVDADTLGDELLDLVVDRPEGTRILVIRPVSASERAAGASSDVEIDVVDVLPSIAYGDEATGESAGVLQVAMRDEGPVITHGAEVPGGVTVQSLIAGDGAQVHEDDRVVAQFTVVGWNDGAVRASTWRTGMPELIDMTTAMRGLRQALVDQRVGSRLAISIPPDLAEGDDTLCVVIDVLGTEPAVSDGREASQSGPSSEQAAQSGA